MDGLLSKSTKRFFIRSKAGLIANRPSAGRYQPSEKGQVAFVKRLDWWIAAKGLWVHRRFRRVFGGEEVQDCRTRLLKESLGN